MIHLSMWPALYQRWVEKWSAAVSASIPYAQLRQVPKLCTVHCVLWGTICASFVSIQLLALWFLFWLPGSLMRHIQICLPKWNESRIMILREEDRCFLPKKNRKRNEEVLLHPNDKKRSSCWKQRNGQEIKGTVNTTAMKPSAFED